ncbi:MAG TPA: NAD(P) transhydrogenase subunit alpha [Phycisphaerae bacterium]|nr:NAD(P) transhydrogenase subunit alpha [Phycisphaerae bacterium]HOI54248.1 NAD(P) transhydrogenase subunit alpha [Phycisphaerae bacterium]
MSALVLVIACILATAVGYRLLGAVPSLLHTPLMSGMNALSGITVLAALLAAVESPTPLGRALASVAVALAMVNVTAGFVVTHRMLRMFKGGSAKETA